MINKQPITDSSIEVSPFLCVPWNDTYYAETSRTVRNPILEGFERYWPITENQFRLWDKYTKSEDPDTHVLTLTLRGQKKKLQDDIFGEHGNNLNLSYNALISFDLILELHTANNDIQPQHDDLWVGFMREYVRAKISHTLKDCITEEQAALVLKRNEQEPLYSSNFGKDITELFIKLFIPEDANTWDYYALRGYTTPAAMKTHFNNIIAQCHSVNPNYDIEPKEYVKNIVWTVPTGIGYPTLNPSLDVEIEQSEQLLSGSTDVHFAATITSQQWFKKNDSDIFEAIQGATQLSYAPGENDSGTYQLQVNWTDSLGEDHVSYSNEITIGGQE